MMGADNLAFVNPEMLIWARDLANMPTEYVAHKLKVKLEKLEQWEKGAIFPTLNQAKKLAALYKVPFGAFFLSEPVKVEKPKQFDYRRTFASADLEDNIKINNEVRDALNKREVYLELLEVLGEPVPYFNHYISISDNYTKTANKIRELLNIDYKKQKTWRNEEAFKYIRAGIEKNGILVFQAKDISVKTMRGMAIYNKAFPIIIVNRKDDKKARCFSLIHELVHVLLRTSSLCDFSEVEGFTEIYCNKIAGECLVPSTKLKEEPLVKLREKTKPWDESEIFLLAKTYSVSREVILRRLLDLKEISKTFYQNKVEDYYKEFIEYKKKRRADHKGFIPPPIDIVSRHGRPFLRTLFEAYYSDILTGADISTILGVKTKHFAKITEEVWK